MICQVEIVNKLKKVGLYTRLSPGLKFSVIFMSSTVVYKECVPFWIFVLGKLSLMREFSDWDAFLR
jgi:hypothetical protein